MANVQTLNRTTDVPASKSTIGVRLGGALLLLLQVALLVGLFVYSVLSFEGTCNGQAASLVELVDCNELTAQEEAAIEDFFIEEIIFFFIYGTVALLACVAVITFLFLRGWLLALGTQGLWLFLALLFFNDLPTEAHVAMLASILMVLYLNSYNVRAAFNR